MYAGPYLLGQTLGRGTAGKVKLGSHRQHKLPVAVKIIRKAMLESNMEAKHRVEREISILKLLRHPHIMLVYDVMQTPSRIFIVLELLSGGELYEYVLQRGQLSAEEVFVFFHHTLLGVEYMHGCNICHRDLKLENLLLDARGCLKIADFGMASTMPEDGLLRTSCGSPHYACPEIVKGEMYNGVQADVWSLGVILFALATGSLPFDDDHLPALFDKIKAAAYTYPRPVAPALQQIVGGMLRVDGPQRLGLADVQRTEWYGRGLGRLPQDGPRVQALCQATQAQLRGTDVPSGGSHSTAEDGGA